MGTGVTNKMPSAKLEVREDESHLSKITGADGEPLDGSNENDVVNAKQIEIFLKESASEYNVQIRVSTAIQNNSVKLKLNMKAQIWEMKLTTAY